MNKFSKLAAAIAALLMVTAIVVTFEACKKENDALLKKDENKSIKPIASMSKQGQMTYYVSVDDLQNKMDAKLSASKETRQFVIEDWYIDTGDGTDLNPLTLVVSVFDVQNEQVITHFFMRECLVSEEIDGVTYYQINPNIISGSYQLASANENTRNTGRGTLFTVSNGNIINIDDDTIIVDKAHPHPYWHVDCSSHFCASVCQREGIVNEDGSYSYGCKQCANSCNGYVGACIANSISIGERILSWFSIFNIFIS